MSHHSQCPPRTGVHWGGPSGGVDGRWGPYMIFRERAGSFGVPKSSAMQSDQFRLIHQTKPVGGGMPKIRVIGVYETMFAAKVAAAKSCRPSARAKRR